MIERCYNPESKEYKYYGLLGVEVDSKWHDFNSFLLDIEHIEGWNLDKFKNRELLLDKDIKIKGNKIYSKDNCKWVSREENLGFLPSRSKKILGINPKGEEFVFYNQSKFAREHNLIQGHISAVLRGERPHHKGWNFIVLQEYNQEPVKNPKKLYTPHYIAYKDGVEVDSDRIKSKLLRRLSIPLSDTNYLKVENEQECYGVKFTIEKRERFNYN